MHSKLFSFGVHQRERSNSSLQYSQSLVSFLVDWTEKSPQYEPLERKGIDHCRFLLTSSSHCPNCVFWDEVGLCLDHCQDTIMISGAVQKVVSCILFSVSCLTFHFLKGYCRPEDVNYLSIAAISKSRLQFTANKCRALTQSLQPCCGSIFDKEHKFCNLHYYEFTRMCKETFEKLNKDTKDAALQTIDSSSPSYSSFPTIQTTNHQNFVKSSHFKQPNQRTVQEQENKRK